MTVNSAWPLFHKSVNVAGCLSAEDFPAFLLSGHNKDAPLIFMADQSTAAAFGTASLGQARIQGMRIVFLRPKNKT